MAELAPHLMKYDYIEPTLFSAFPFMSLSNPLPINKTPLADNIDVIDLYFILELLYDQLSFQK